MTQNLLLDGFKFIFDNLEHFEISYSLLFSIIGVCVIYSFYKNHYSFEKKLLDLFKK